MRDCNPKFARVKVQGGRIHLPARLAARLPYLTGSEAIRAWLLVLESGRYRLLPDAAAKESGPIRRLLERMNAPDEAEAEVEPFEADTAPDAALVARLLPATLSPKGPPGWRLTLPRDLPELGESDEMALLLHRGYLEVWSLPCLKDAMKHSPDGLLTD